ncbi:VC2046/SO_2500 family protein [Moritella sp. Urea-trap-13]|uniref:VC2046/SO_2500 family protein n=1 Tax=Moritella sp. Urea-trap-13 TaxID=2058327 RepID=UPI00210661EC|nr:VC2046/SO_2500 family protein [Moritella sp. Urea-trap-13]
MVVLRAILFKRYLIYVQSIRQHALIDELQLGQQLNKCAVNGDRAKFALLLSMLSSDISDQKQIEIKQPVVDTSAYDAARMVRLNEYAASNNMAAMRLEICFSPEVAVAVGDTKYVPESVVQNSSHLLQQKLAHDSLIKPTLSELAQAAEFTQDPTSPSDISLSTANLLDVLNSYDASKPLKIREYG